MALGPPVGKPSASQVSSGVYLLDPLFANTEFYYLFDEGTGTNIEDLSVNGLDLTAFSIEEDDWLDSGLRFEGVSEYAETANDAVLRLTGDLSVGAWVRINTWVASRGLLEIARGSSEAEVDNIVLLFQVLNSAASINMSVFHEHTNGANESVAFTPGLAEGTAYYIAVVRDATAKTYTMYVDGVVVSSGGYTTNATVTGDPRLVISHRAALDSALTTTFHTLHGASRVWSPEEIVGFAASPYSMFGANTSGMFLVF